MLGEVIPHMSYQVPTLNLSCAASILEFAVDFLQGTFLVKMVFQMLPFKWGVLTAIGALELVLWTFWPVVGDHIQIGGQVAAVFTAEGSKGAGRLMVFQILPFNGGIFTAIGTLEWVLWTFWPVVVNHIQIGGAVATVFTAEWSAWAVVVVLSARASLDPPPTSMYAIHVYKHTSGEFLI